MDRIVPAADRLLARKEKILDRWEDRVRREIPSAAQTSEPILLDTMPAILRQLAEAMSEKHPRRIATEGSSVAEEHGGERVRLTRYRLQDVILEYRVLREVVVSELEQSGPVTQQERNALNASIDEAITRACGAYVLVQEGFRERFFSMLAHDLRGPISGARMSAELILRKPSSELVPRWAERAVESLERADRMVQDLLDAMRLQAGARLPIQFEPCDLVDLVRQSIEQLEAEHGRRFVLVASEPVKGYFAPEPLRRAFGNLGSNAVKYGAPSRSVTFTVRTEHGRAQVKVHNYGEPIPTDQQEMIFHRFERSPHGDSSGKPGWGLGLAQVRAVAEAHGGSIGVDSLPETGTTFCLDIPVDSRELEAPETPVLEASPE